MATLGLKQSYFKINIIVSVHEVINKILSIELDYIVDVVM